MRMPMFITGKSYNRYQDAIECYEKAISINPKFDLAWNNKGSALNSLNRYQEAIRCCEKAISINPKIFGAHTNKGFALQQQKKYQNAVDCYEQALSICNDPQIRQLKLIPQECQHQERNPKLSYISIIDRLYNELTSKHLSIKVYLNITKIIKKNIYIA
ncbi:unnamed protein product [Paramecium octaurelia]|uniref:Tetratricopeptide repeat protein n=1 Tax=Paramecium octaurelia TaxID=43137 RepID=A0A8S1YML2_PAROT|nr:unnamed protein product [Paramecium octaurelia]